MRRRDFIIGTGSAASALVSLPLTTAHAQKAGKVYRIGFLRNGPPPQSFIEGFRQGLRELGYIEGQNITIEYGLAGSADELPDAAAELVRQNVDVIIASGTVAAAKNATRTIPIVFVASIDPIATGIVDSLARPGGNVTGFAGIHADLMGKRLELLKEMIPNLSRVALLSQAKNPGNAEDIRQAEPVASALGLQLQVVAVLDTAEFEHAFKEMRSAGAFIQLDDVLFTTYRKQIVELASREQLPAIYGFGEFADAGGLISYGSDLPGQYRSAASYVDKILKGAKPADLPVQQPSKLELIVNLKTARAMRLEIPSTILTRADKVIE